MDSTLLALLALGLGVAIGAGIAAMIVAAWRARIAAHEQASAELPDGLTDVLAAMDDAACAVDSSGLVTAASAPASRFGIGIGATLENPELRQLVRSVREGETVGYGATWTARRDSRVAVANMGYADGYLRCHAGTGSVATWQGHMLPLIGRVSMDLIAFDASDAGAITEGDWLALAYDLPAAATASGLSQYELLTGLGVRFERRWVG